MSLHATRPLRALAAALLIWSSAVAPVLAADDKPEPPKPSPECMEGIPGELKPLWEKVCTSEKRNQVLAHMTGGLAALTSGHLPLAERSLDIALGGIETVYADDPAAEKARSVWHAEDVKEFKGEPYERAMAYYYRGLAYLAKGDWDNAQASFQGGVLQDTFAEMERHRADVGSLVWLEGWANSCRGNTSRAGELFAEAQSINPALKPPAKDETVLVVAESGQAPRKFRAGNNGEKLGIREGLIGNYALAARLGEAAVPLARAEDLFYQATTRGGRAADKILAEKSATKDGTEALGMGMIVGGLAAANYNSQSRNNNNDAAAAGLAIALIGLMVYAASQNMDAGADIRTWINLPHSVHLAALPAENFDPRKLTLVDPAGRDVLSPSARLLVAAPGPCTLVWIGAHNVVPSLAVEAAADGSAGNCRTSAGTLVTMPPPTCKRIGGQPLGGEGAVGLKMDAAAAATRFSNTCRTSTGAVAELDADTCQRIGGTPQ
ncbi:MAG: hypothetical protein AB1918_12320 [Pseudomonadota bacterium]